MRKLLFGAVLIILAAGMSCSGKQNQSKNTAEATTTRGANAALAASSDTTKAIKQDTTKPPVDSTQHEGMEHKSTLDKGIGPVKEVKLGPLDPKLAKQGQSLFNANCGACHTLDVKKVGPPLRGITNTHAPEFIMNMILNPTEMQKKNHEIMELVEDYGVLMSDLHLKNDQARAIVEYLRSESEKSKPAGK
jgi:mono/diheme cytochrome c family protein